MRDPENGENFVTLATSPEAHRPVTTSWAPSYVASPFRDATGASLTILYSNLRHDN